MLTRGGRNQAGYTAVDVVTGLTLFALTLVSLYQVLLPTFALWRNSDDRIARQQDVRLAIDRLARDLHETTMAFGRLKVYTAGEGCTGAYEACIGFATARDTGCGGTFQLTASGDPNWQAIVYVWRDVPSRELRRRCDTSVQMPATTWPPALTPHEVIGRRVILTTFTPLPAGPNPRGIEMVIREVGDTAARPTYRYQTNFYNQTLYLPQN